jgi:hypothetical protein
VSAEREAAKRALAALGADAKKARHARLLPASQRPRGITISIGVGGEGEGATMIEAVPKRPDDEDEDEIVGPSD